VGASVNARMIIISLFIFIVGGYLVVLYVMEY